MNTSNDTTHLIECPVCLEKFDKRDLAQACEHFHTGKVIQILASHKHEYPNQHFNSKEKSA